MQQVNFSELNELKKQQFFNYLLSNNIQFKEGQSNYYAKVVLKQTKPTVANLNLKPPKAKSKDRLKQKQRQKEKDINRQKENKPPRFNSKERELTIKRPVIQRLSTPTRSQSPILKSKRKQLSLSDYSHDTPLNLSDIIATTTQKSEKCKTQRNYTDNSREMNRDNSYKQTQHKIVERQKVVVPRFGGSKEKEQKNYEKPQIVKSDQRLLPFLRIFKISSILFRPSKWPRHQLDKAIQEIYAACFIKNNIIVKTKKIKETIEKESVFASFIAETYEQKFKTKKSIQFNIVSLVDSLISHLDIDRSKNLVMFQKFLSEDYQYQDLIFFLFVRNLGEKQLKQSQDRFQRKVRTQDDDFKFLFSEKQAIKLIKTLVMKDKNLLEQYTSLIQQYISDGTIPIYQFLEILLENYRMKRQNSSTTSGRQSHPSAASTNNNTTYIRQRSNFMSKPAQHHSIDHGSSESEQLTFGQSTIRNRQPNDTFWYQTNQKAQIPSDPLQLAIVQKMDKRISDLIKHILDDDDEFRLTISQFHGLIFNKARNLINAIFQMDKISWFRMLNIRQPQSHNLCHIESLQKMIRMLKNQQDPHLINKFCKNILTTQEFLEAIKKIVIG